MPRDSSRVLIWRETADWLSFRFFPASVRLPASATAWKILSLSQSVDFIVFFDILQFVRCVDFFCGC